MLRMLHAFLAFDASLDKEVLLLLACHIGAHGMTFFLVQGKVRGRFQGRWLSFTVFFDPGIFPGKNPGKMALREVPL